MLQGPVVAAGAQARVVALDLLGARVDLRICGGWAGRLEASVRQVWHRCLASDPRTPPEATVAVRHDAAERLQPVRDADPAASADETVLLDHLSTRLTQQALALRVGRLLLLHACAVADPATGAAAVLVGPSGVGKTTASLILGRRFGYVTDETAALDADGRLYPYPKPLSLLVDGRRPKRQLSPDDLGLLPTPSAPRLAAIALLTRRGDAPPAVSPVRTIDALPALADQSSSLYLLPRPLHLVAGLLDRVGGLRRVEYSEAEDLPDLVSGLLEGSR